MPRSLSRAFGVLTAGAVVASGVALLTAQSASAQGSNTELYRASWSYADSRAAHDTLGGDDSDVRVGSWRDADGKRHTSKAYFTFDLSDFTDRQILGARVVASEVSANDCSKPRSTQLWAVPVTTKPTWADQPAETAKLPGGSPGLACLSDWVGWDATQVVQDAIANGESSVRLAMRIAEEFLGDVAYGRKYQNGLRMFVDHNSRPDTPSGLMVDNQRCTDTSFWNASREVQLSAYVEDPDRDELTVEFELWPVDKPEEVTQQAAPIRSGFRRSWTVREGLLEHERSYVWRVRAKDDHFISAWSDECRFTNDFVSPSAPSVSSGDYPNDGDWHGGAGVPGEFTFDAQGVEDVVAFQYSALGGAWHEVAAAAPGGTATVTYTPTKSGPDYLAVRSVDRSGRVSELVYYDFQVAQSEPVSDAPEVSSTDYPADQTSGGVGVPGMFAFKSRLPDVTEFDYCVSGPDGETCGRVGAADGIADVTFTPTSAGWHSISVVALSADGSASAQTDYYFDVQG